MPIKVERFSGESIIIATVAAPFNPEADIPVMFGKFIPMRLAIQGSVVFIIDFSATMDQPEAFGTMVQALAGAARGVQVSKAVGVSGPPITIFVGSGAVAEIASQAMEQEQYGGVKGRLCVSLEDALTLARTLLAAPSP